MDHYMLKFDVICKINQDELRETGKTLFDLASIQNDEDIDRNLVTLFRTVDGCSLLYRTLIYLERSSTVVAEIMRDIERRSRKEREAVALQGDAPTTG